jgi:ABC-type transport system involved in multi-copper enzyme maturation permease subunit
MTDGRQQMTIKEVFPSVTKPLTFGYSDGWAVLIQQFSNIIIFLSVLVIIAITPVFSEEYSSQTAAVILTTKHGKHSCILAKIIAAFLFGFLIYASFSLFNLLLHGAYYGFSGFEVSIQCSYLGMFVAYPADMTYGFLLTLMFSYFLLALFLLTAFTLIFSAVCRTSFIAVIISIITYILPNVIAMVTDRPVIRRITSLFPIQIMNLRGSLLTGLKYSIFTNSFDVRQIVIFSSLVVSALLCFGSYQAFKNYQVR